MRFYAVCVLEDRCHVCGRTAPFFLRVTGGSKLNRNSGVNVLLHSRGQ
jgi:hypothetical protein